MENILWKIFCHAFIRRLEITECALIKASPELEMQFW